MVVVWLAVVLLLVPGISAGQPPAPPEAQRPATTAPERQPAPGAVPLQVPGLVIGVSPPGTFPVDVSPRTPPSPTIPSGPTVILPTPPPDATRPRRLFEFHPTLGVSEEYSDNFLRSERNPQANFRSMVSPGLQVLLDSGSLTGSAAYTLSAFYDTQPKEPGFHHTLAALLAWQATPRLRLSLAEAFLVSDDPAQADSLQLEQARRTFTSNQLSLTGEYSLGTIEPKAYFRRSDFTSDTATTQTNAVGLSATASLGRIHTVTAGYEYLVSDTTFSTTTAVPAANGSTVTGHEITASFSRDLTATTTAGISGAYAIRDHEAGNRSTSFTRRSISLFSNYILTDKLIVRSDIGIAQLNSGSSSGDPLVTSTSNISYWLGPATFSLGIARGFAETFGQGQDFGVVKTSGYTGSVLYRFTPLFSGEINGSYRENEFTGVGGGTAGTTNTVYTAGINITYQIARWLTGTIEAVHTHESSNSQASFSENRVRASLNAILY
jgi:hypothetical protein